MRILIGCACAASFLACLAWTQHPPAVTAISSKSSQPASASDSLRQMLESNVKTEWEAFKNRKKQAYSDLLADDFVAVEDDNQGMRNKSAAAAEIDGSVVRDYHLFALNVVPLDANAALVTYEITLDFPITAQVRLKRVLVSEVWLRRNGHWKERYYQETHVR